MRDAYLGISSSDTDQGVAVESVGSGSAAEAAGLQPGDVIVAFDGREVDATENLVSALRGKTAGDENVVDADFEEVKDDKKKSA